MSEIAKIIDTVIAVGLAPAAKTAGFAKGGRTFWRTDGEAVLVTNVQASQWNHGAEGTFTINLGVWFPAVGARSPYPATRADRPPHHVCQVRQRIGGVMPGLRDHWWRVDSTTDTSIVGEEVAAAWRTHGVPWLEQHRDLAAEADSAEERDEAFLAIQFRFAQGRVDAARTLLQKLLAKRPPDDAHGQWVSAWATKNGLA